MSKRRLVGIVFLISLLLAAVFALLVSIRVIHNPFDTNTEVPVPMSKQEFLESVERAPLSNVDVQNQKKQFVEDISQSSRTTTREQRVEEQKQKGEFIDAFRQSNN